MPRAPTTWTPALRSPLGDAPPSATQHALIRAYLASSGEEHHALRRRPWGAPSARAPEAHLLRRRAWSFRPERALLVSAIHYRWNVERSVPPEILATRWPKVIRKCRQIQGMLFRLLAYIRRLLLGSELN